MVNSISTGRNPSNPSSFSSITQKGEKIFPWNLGICLIYRRVTICPQNRRETFFVAMAACFLERTVLENWENVEKSQFFIWMTLFRFYRIKFENSSCQILAQSHQKWEKSNDSIKAIWRHCDVMIGNIKSASAFDIRLRPLLPLYKVSLLYDHDEMVLRMMMS